LYSFPSVIRIIKEDEMGRTFSTHGEKGNAYRNLVGIPKAKRPLGIPRYGWEDNTQIRMDLTR
jgi:hypothetical protein